MMVDEPTYSLLTDLTCPNCSNYFTPPITICPVGHSMCHACSGKLRQCPVCNITLPKTRNLTLENICAKVNFPCKYRYLGCDKLITGSALRQHQRECPNAIQCPGCSHHFTPPIKTCQLGHNMCKTCSDRFPGCPVCRSPHSNTRNLELEGVCANLSFPCKYESSGCKKLIRGSHLKQHHLECGYGDKSCPMYVCNIEGNRSEMETHLLANHADNKIFFGDFSTVISFKKDSHWRTVIKKFDELFILTVIADKTTKVIKTYLNSLFELDNFVTYHFVLTLSYKDKPLFASVGVCHDYCETQPDDYFVVPKEVVLEFEAKYDNKIYFTAAIFKTPTDYWLLILNKMLVKENIFCFLYSLLKYYTKIFFRRKIGPLFSIEPTNGGNNN